MWMEDVNESEGESKGSPLFFVLHPLQLDAISARSDGVGGARTKTALAWKSGGRTSGFSISHGQLEEPATLYRDLWWPPICSVCQFPTMAASGIRVGTPATPPSQGAGSQEWQRQETVR